MLRSVFSDYGGQGCPAGTHVPFLHRAVVDGQTPPSTAPLPPSAKQMFGHAWPASTHWPSQQRSWVGEGQICPASGGGTHIAPGGMQPQGEMTSGGGQTLPPSTLQMGP